MDVGILHSCVISTRDEMKCFGRGQEYQLGNGDNTENIGDEAGEMGCNLLPIEFGEDFTPKQVKCGQLHTCVLST
eukprot:CAMPEP_0202707076 /NCGR_PEP_ID=MMETSP1385-20130828/19424_1 /ASSEMBLY_ACC=CAM_ASM_000861 /TAXON_ID=933848 /ORGANISM="Elphidium margaritaceum" /LENGTH=74 /DNA_ID=CAMNT_0049365697 /DNA_START=13 /DNA_END=233 /DNA_ORIENTATION=+